ncbi:MAG: hypothetical protein Q8M11_17150 [Sulfuritalea sp.]|nr:hypothetical protein [Sulfuritalea sp.]MDP1984715.1 hypothetical protein [Sulfuritalea sp.]
MTDSLAVAFVDADDYAAKSGSAWLWWPDGSRPPARCDFDGRFPPDWGMLLVMSEAALETVCAEGESCMAGLVRRLQIKPFLLQQRDMLEAAGILDFIESLELATPKH